MKERARIARYFAPLTAAETGSFALTDDAAMLTPPQGQALIITTDSVIEHVHVLANATPEQFAQKLMRRNLSDVAAMGGTPWRYLLNLHTPTGLEEAWFAEFAATLEREQAAFGLVLVGGDSTSGASAIHTTMTCLALMDRDDAAPLRRSGAAAGEDIYVSGSLGGAAYALHLLQKRVAITHTLAARYHCPTPRLQLGQALRGVATSCMDVSDGLLSDLGQLVAASNVGAAVQRNRLPVDAELAATITADETAWRFVLSGGDDYELLFTAPKAARGVIEGLALQLELPLTIIGEITAAQCGITLRDERGAPLPMHHAGWEHC